MVVCVDLEGWDGRVGGRFRRKWTHTHTHTHTHTQLIKFFVQQKLLLTKHL